MRLWEALITNRSNQMIFDIIKKNKTLQELMCGIILFGLLGEVIILIFPQRIYNSLGFITGIAVSLICAVHMAWGIDITTMLDEKAAITYSRKYTVIRYLIMCAALAITGVTDLASPITLIIGYCALKAGAYMNPFIHKFFNKHDNSFTVNKSSGGEEQQ